MMMSRFNNYFIGNVFTAETWTHQIGGGFNNGGTVGLFNKPVENAGPVVQDGGGIVENLFLGANLNDTAGMIGSITKAPDGTFYFYYTDGGGSAGPVTLYRRTISNTSTTNSMGPPVTLHTLTNMGAPNPIEVHYLASKNQYVALYYCLHAVNNVGYYDLCLRRFSDANLSSPVDGGPLFSEATFGGTDAALFGIALHLDPDVPRWASRDVPTSFPNGNYYLSQFGVRKNQYGQIETDANGDITVYFTIGDPGYNVGPHIR